MWQKTASSSSVNSVLKLKVALAVQELHKFIPLNVSHLRVSRPPLYQLSYRVNWDWFLTGFDS